MTVVVDRSHGGSSLKEGVIEIMLVRRTITADSVGVGQPLGEDYNYPGR